MKIYVILVTIHSKPEVYLYKTPQKRKIELDELYNEYSAKYGYEIKSNDDLLRYTNDAVCVDLFETEVF